MLHLKINAKEKCWISLFELSTFRLAYFIVWFRCGSLWKITADQDPLWRCHQQTSSFIITFRSSRCIFWRDKYTLKWYYYRLTPATSDSFRNSSLSAILDPIVSISPSFISTKWRRVVDVILPFIRSNEFAREKASHTRLTGFTRESGGLGSFLWQRYKSATPYSLLLLLNFFCAWDLAMTLRTDCDLFILGPPSLISH